MEISIENNNLDFETGITKVYPKLDNLTITPTSEKQVFNHPDSYGYDNVKVNAIESETLDVIPGIEKQEFNGMYHSVKVSGDSDLTPENIKYGVEIFGVIGIGKMVGIEINDGQNLFYNGSRDNCLQELLSFCKDLTNCASMFYYSTVNTIDMGNINTSNCADFSSMFNNCRNLTNLNISNLNTSNATSFTNMFTYCNKLAELDLSSFNTSKVTRMDGMFAYCSMLKELDLSNFDFRSVTNMSSFATGCTQLTDVVLSNPNYSGENAITSSSTLFNRCTNLINADVENLDLGKNTNFSTVFGSCSNLTNLKFFTNVGKGYTQKSSNYGNYSITLSSSTKLTHDSLLDVINKLYDLNLTYDVANGGTLYTQKLVIGSTNVAKLTADEIAIATNKGWVVS